MADVTLAQCIAATRFGLGAKPGEFATIGDDPKTWLKNQTTAGNGSVISTPMISTQEFAEQIWAGVQSPTIAAVSGLTMEYLLDYNVRVRTKFAQATNASFRERLVRFWTNHFSVSNRGELGLISDALEREVIRPRVMGKFSDLLIATSQHPVMINYLENTYSRGRQSPRSISEGGGGLNENLAREILELHTLGVDGGYSQADVTSFANAITGWTITNKVNGARPYGRFYFETAFHEPGPVTFMGKTYNQTGVDQGVAILKEVANHPAAIARVCEKLAVHFHSDDPPASLVNALVQAWVSSGGDLGAVSRALVDAPELWIAGQSKVKSTDDFVISMWRALYPYFADNWEIWYGFMQMGQPPFGASSPAGWPDVDSAWSAPGILRQRLSATTLLACNFYNLVTQDVVGLGDSVLGPLFTSTTSSQILAMPNNVEGLAVLFLSPEFQRR